MTNSPPLQAQGSAVLEIASFSFLEPSQGPVTPAAGEEAEMSV